MRRVAKKTKEKKSADLERVREYAEEYPLVAVVENPGIPNNILKKIREDFGDETKILFVKKKMASALYKMPAMPKGTFFLVFGTEAAVEKIKLYQYQDFLEEDDVCPIRAVIEKQVVRDKEAIGLLPVSAKDEQMQLTEDYVVCEENETVDERKARILKLFGKRLKKKSLAVFDVVPAATLLQGADN